MSTPKVATATLSIQELLTISLDIEHLAKRAKKSKNPAQLKKRLAKIKAKAETLSSHYMEAQELTTTS